MARIDTSNPMEPLLFGALISAVDPVATLSIMGSPELNCDPLLYRYVVHGDGDGEYESQVSTGLNSLGFVCACVVEYFVFVCVCVLSSF